MKTVGDVLSERFIEAGYTYWQWYQDKVKAGDAVVWLQNDQTGMFVLFTRGEYAEDIKRLIKELK